MTRVSTVITLYGYHVSRSNGVYSEVKGILDEVDAWMNLTLVQATQTTAQGESCDLDIAFIKGVTIRYVHISDKINMRSHLTAYLRRIKTIATNNAPRMIKR